LKLTGRPIHSMATALHPGRETCFYINHRKTWLWMSSTTSWYKTASSPFGLERAKECDTLQEVSMYIDTRFLVPIIIIIPCSYAQSLCNSTTVLHTVCAGNEDKVLSYGCAKQPEPLTIEYCKSHCRCGAGNQLQCPEYVTCFDEKINATEKCGSPYIWSCGCSA
jgi:hypothetical protein